MDINWFAPITVLMIGLALLSLGFFFKVRRKDAFKTAGTIITGIGVIGLFFLPVSDVRDIAGSLTVSDDVDTTGTTVSTSCPDTDLTTLYLKSQDDSASTLTYTSDITFIQSVSNGLYTNDSTETTGYVSMGNLPCGQTYNLYGVTKVDTYSSFDLKGVTLSGSQVYKTVENHAVSPVSIRVKDLSTDAYQAIFPDNQVSAATNSTTSYTRLNTTNVLAAGGATTAGDNITVGTDGTLDLEIYLKTDSANEYFSDLGTYFCVDVGTDVEWAEPSVAFEGRELTETKASIMNKYPQDSTGSLLSGADYCYVLGETGKEIGDTSKLIEFSIKARSGQNPDESNDDIILTFMPVGSFDSSEDLNTIKYGAYNDASTQTMVVQSAQPPKLTIQID